MDCGSRFSRCHATPVWQPASESVMLGLLKAPVFVCIRKEFNNLAAGKSSPHHGTLRALCRKIMQSVAGPVWCAIGMCYTGGFVFAMMVEASLLAPVAAQPSLPFFQPEGLDVEPEKLALRCPAAADAMSLLGLRSRMIFAALRLDSSGCEASLQGEPGSSVPRFRSVTVPGEGIRPSPRLPDGPRSRSRYTRAGAPALARTVARRRYAHVATGHII